MVGPCGGGYGNPLERDSMQVVEDVRDGYLSLERARSDYGVVVTPSLELDAAATEDLRRELRAN
jgi:N-methylhydantoinase B